MKKCDLFQVLCVCLATVVVSAINRQRIYNKANHIDVVEKNDGANEEIDDDQNGKGGSNPNASYEYGYNVNDPLSNDVKSHHEIRDGEYVYGYYTFKEADGSTRVVNYKVGPNTGFQATVERLQLGEQASVKLPKKQTPPSPPNEQESLPTESSTRSIIRGRGRGRNHQFSLRSPNVESPARDSSSYERGYRQDPRPVRGRARTRSRGEYVASPHRSRGETNPDWQNSVLGRQRIQKQIAILAEKKKQEAAKEAERKAQEEKEKKAAREQEKSAEEDEEEEEDGDREEEVEDYDDDLDRDDDDDRVDDKEE